MRLNPDGARELYAILRTAPVAVKRKAGDPFGPLGLMVVPDSTNPPPSKLRRWMRPALPDRLRAEAAAFREDWMGYRFTKAELADCIAQFLRQMGETVPSVEGPWQVIRPR